MIEMPPLPPLPVGLTVRVFGPTVETLLRRVAYGGRKGRSADRRLRQPRYEQPVIMAKWRAAHPDEEPNLCCVLQMPTFPSGPITEEDAKLVGELIGRVGAFMVHPL